jgi:hypothetical protein
MARTICRSQTFPPDGEQAVASDFRQAKKWLTSQIHDIAIKEGAELAHVINPWTTPAILLSAVCRFDRLLVAALRIRDQCSQFEIGFSILLGPVRTKQHASARWTKAFFLVASTLCL